MLCNKYDLLKIQEPTVKMCVRQNSSDLSKKPIPSSNFVSARRLVPASILIVCSLHSPCFEYPRIKLKIRSRINLKPKTSQQFSKPLLLR